jgi:hydrogenase maturation protease
VRKGKKKIVVLGMGNLLLKDEGIGVHVANAMQEMPSSGSMELEVVDGGTLPDAPISFGDVDKLIIVDAVKSGGESGVIYRFHTEDIRLDDRVLTSLHQVSLLENLWLTERFGKKPKEVIIIGIEPEEMGWGLELSEKLQKKIPQIIKVVLKEAGLNNSDKP